MFWVKMFVLFFLEVNLTVKNYEIAWLLQSYPVLRSSSYQLHHYMGFADYGPKLGVRWVGGNYSLIRGQNEGHGMCHWTVLGKE